jgi:MFS family permease
MAFLTARAASVLRSSSFARFYAGQTLSYLGDGLRTLAIPLLVFRLTGSGAAIGWAWGLELLPYAAVSVIGGSLADRVDRRRLMLACDALRFVVMMLFAVALATGRLTIGMIYAGVLILAIGGSIFLGAQSSSIPFLLGKDRVKAGVAALQATEQGVNLIAPPIGGAIFGVAGPLPALLLNAITYLASQVSIASVPTFGPEKPSGIPSPREIAADITAGWRFLWGDRALRTLSLYNALFNSVATIGFVSLIPYFKRAFGAEDHVVGIAFGCFAAGAALGSVIAGRTHVPFARGLLLTYVLDGLSWLPLAWTQALPLAIAAMVVSSACTGYGVTTIVSWRMRVIPEHLVGRVFGVIRLIVLGGILPGSVLGGWLADRVGVRPTMEITAFGYLAIALTLAVSRTVRAERR